MTAKEAVALYCRTGKPSPPSLAKPDASKYNARKKEIDGHTFDSTGEANVYVYLKASEAAGVISKLELQPRFVLQAAFRDEAKKHHRAIEYVADFRFLDCNGETYVIDYKGFRTALYRMKLKMFKAKFPDVKFEEWDRAKLREISR